MAESQSISLSDLDLTQLGEIKKQFEEVLSSLAIYPWMGAKLIDL